jgi:YebC/PmpR family DNA-binding regulatory protein
VIAGHALDRRDGPDEVAVLHMAGHSQFKNIMFRKGKQDKERSKLFSKLAREITVAAKQGLPDPAHNARLRAAIIAARAENMPKDNIERAIKKAQGRRRREHRGSALRGLWPRRRRLIIEALTDNRNRTAGDVRSAFTKYGGALGETNSVSFMFDRVGVIAYPKEQGQRRRDARGGDRGRRRRMRLDDEGHEFLCRVEISARARCAGSEARPAAIGAIEWRAQNYVAVPDENGRALVKLLEVLDDHDDVQHVYGNYELSDALMEKLSA